MLYATRCEASVLVRVKKRHSSGVSVTTVLPSDLSFRVIAKSAVSPLRLVRPNDLLVMEQTGCRGLNSRCAYHKIAVFRRNEFGSGISAGLELLNDARAAPARAR